MYEGQYIKKSELLARLIDARTEHMYNNYFYQGIQIAIEVVDKMPVVSLEDDGK